MNSNSLIVKKLLTYTFGIVPIVAAFDKFTNILTDWTRYISPGFSEILPFDTSTFMTIVGVIEIVAYIVMAWLVLIALTLLFSGNYLDVAVRDLVMAIAAFSLAKLSEGNLVKVRN